MATRRRRPRAPKLPASISAPDWALDGIVKNTHVFTESIYNPWQEVDKINERLRDQKWGVHIPFPGGYQGKASLQIGRLPGLHEPSGSLVLPIVAYVVGGAIKGGSANVPLDNAHMYIAWEPAEREQRWPGDRALPGFLIVSQLVRASDPEPDMQHLLTVLKDRSDLRRRGE